MARSSATLQVVIAARRGEPYLSAKRAMASSAVSSSDLLQGSGMTFREKGADIGPMQYAPAVLPSPSFGGKPHLL
jgi:hypothetical protein